MAPVWDQYEPVPHPTAAPQLLLQNQYWTSLGPVWDQYGPVLAPHSCPIATSAEPVHTSTDRYGPVPTPHSRPIAASAEPVRDQYGPVWTSSNQYHTPQPPHSYLQNQYGTSMDQYGTSMDQYWQTSTGSPQLPHSCSCRTSTGPVRTSMDQYRHPTAAL
ncbi:sodium/glucose cotransporter 2-like [Grus japonensis]|uniref:Sodium/glucose cotransporter 2-like n=1 Tax=Grus japonensis TaxID=30415 RepID=A0ABC9XWX4_GRUJA